MDNDSNYRVKYYGRGDMATGYEFDKGCKVLEKYSNNAQISDINDALELYDIKKYFNDGVRLPHWGESEKNHYTKILEDKIKDIGVFINKINDDSLIEIYESLDVQYIEEFWEAFYIYKVYNHISKESFLQLLSSKPVPMEPILKHKKLVEYYDEEICQMFLLHPSYAEILIKKYLVADNNEIHIPKGLSPRQKTEILDTYIKWKDANLNYIDVIEKSRTTANDKEGLPISDKTRLSAKRVKDTFWKEHFEKNAGITMGVQVSFQSEMSEIMVATHSGDVLEITYDRDWIENNLDYPTLMNNFIYLFGYVDLKYKSRFPSTTSKLSIFERYLGVKAKNEYPTGIAFSQLETLHNLQMRGYRKILERHQITVESLIEWFFEEYLKEEFGIDGMRFEKPSPSTSYLERIKLLASSIDGILRRYKYFVEDGNIDEELVQISSTPTTFSSIPSLIEEKYAYCKSKDLEQEQGLLFSDQSRLLYIKKIGSKYTSLPNLLTNEVIKASDYIDYQKPFIDWLIERGAINVDEENVLKINTNRAQLLKELWEDGVICVRYCQDSLGLLKKWVESSEIEIKSTLFSEPEQHYLNYMLNKAEYGNARELRNHYIHCTNTQEEITQERDYDDVLRILIMVVLKINEEVCLKFPQEKK